MLALATVLVDDEGDKELFRQLFNKFKNTVYSVACHFLSSEALAEEASQETFFLLAKNFKTVKGLGKGDIEGYIIVTAKHTAINTYRKEKKHLRRDTVDEDELIDSDLSAFDRVHIRRATERCCICTTALGSTSRRQAMPPRPCQRLRT